MTCGVTSPFGYMVEGEHYTPTHSHTYTHIWREKYYFKELALHLWRLASLRSAGGLAQGPREELRSQWGPEAICWQNSWLGGSVSVRQTFT